SSFLFKIQILNENNKVNVFIYHSVFLVFIFFKISQILNFNRPVFNESISSVFTKFAYGG
ncbi:hypothetical protein, partial [Arcobacter sp.]|uniref:hypothetical protein n=1 Tax=Arcobacter sp. TaxID=1872629 RepID=UPI003D122C5D